MQFFLNVQIKNNQLYCLLLKEKRDSLELIDSKKYTLADNRYRSIMKIAYLMKKTTSTHQVKSYRINYILTSEQLTLKRYKIIENMEHFLTPLDADHRGKIWTYIVEGNNKNVLFIGIDQELLQTLRKVSNELNASIDKITWEGLRPLYLSSHHGLHFIVLVLRKNGIELWEMKKGELLTRQTVGNAIYFQHFLKELDMDASEFYHYASKRDIFGKDINRGYKLPNYKFLHAVLAMLPKSLKEKINNRVPVYLLNELFWSETFESLLMQFLNGQKESPKSVFKPKDMKNYIKEEYISLFGGRV